jgi:hypothetical protein
MKIALPTVCSLMLLTFGAQAQIKAKADTSPKPDELRRLESVTWDLKTHTLRWTVQKGTEVNGDFVPSSSERYEITPDQALMTAGGEKRGFETDEAVLLHRLLDAISMYCAQSVVWWEHGEGTPVGDGPKLEEPMKPAAPEEKPAAKPTDTKPIRMLPLGVAEVAEHPAWK